MLIGICGKLGVGKDFITTNYIIPLLEKRGGKYLQLAFADQIKVNVMSKKNIPYEDVYENKTTESRILLQNEGTEERNRIGQNIWTDYLDNWIKVFKSRSIEHFIISDVRFRNELDYIKKNNGILIKIIAPKRNLKRLMNESNGNQEVIDQISSHRSECDLDNVDDSMFDIVIYNDPGQIINEYDLNNTFNVGGNV
jgi:hypothetical protein